jgi:hypothetical protein
MDFIKFSMNNETHFIAVDQIGHWAVSPYVCDKCKVIRYVIDIYDRKGFLLCSFVDTEEEIKKLSKGISSVVNVIPIP